MLLLALTSIDAKFQRELEAQFEATTAATYRNFYEQGGQRDSIYHRRIDFSVVEELLKYYYGPDFVMDAEARSFMAKFAASRGVDPRKGKLASGASVESDIDSNAQSDDQGTESNSDNTHDLKVNQQQDDAADLNLSAEKLDYYGSHIYEELKDFVPFGGKVFEPGASWGKMLHPWKVLHGCEATGVEPKIEAVRMAKKRFGLSLLQGFADDPRIPEDTYDLVINTRTINHMLDPLGDLRNAWRWLKPDGILFVDIQDTIREARYESFERNVVEIDHPYMFSLNTLTAMVQKAGFVIVKKKVTDLQRVRDWDDRPPQTKQIRIIARKATGSVAIDWPDPMAELAALMQAQLEFDRDERNRNRQLRRQNQQRKAENALLRRELVSPGARIRGDLRRLCRFSARLPALLKSLLPKLSPTTATSGRGSAPS